LERFAPTRINLLSLKRQLQISINGARLLRSKRDALMRDFFKLAGECLDLRSRLGKEIRDATYKLHLAKALSGDGIYSAAHALKREIDLAIKVKNIWGIHIPEIEEKRFSRRLEAMDISPIGEGTLIIDTAKGFEKAVDTIVSIASSEVRLSRTGEEIRGDTRKINALEEILIPSIRHGIKWIETILEEREREDIFRLKRYKKKKRGG